MTKIWSPNNIKALIEQYEINEILWNSKLAEYRDRNKKNQILKELSEKFSCSASEIQRKIHNLRNQMSQELKKCRNKKSGSGTNEAYSSNWPYFNTLKFLIPFLSPSSTQSNLVKMDNCLDKPKEQPTEIEKEIIKITGSKIGERREMKRKYGNNKGKSKKHETEEEENAFETAMKILKRQADEYDIFGEYVAQELRSLRSDTFKRKLKSAIRKAIVLIAEEDDAFLSAASMNASSSSSSSASWLH